MGTHFFSSDYRRSFKYLFFSWVYQVDVYNIMDFSLWCESVSALITESRFLMLLVRTVLNSWYFNAEHMFLNYEKIKENKLIKALL